MEMIMRGKLLFTLSAVVLISIILHAYRHGVFTDTAKEIQRLELQQKELLRYAEAQKLVFNSVEELQKWRKENPTLTAEYMANQCRKADGSCRTVCQPTNFYCHMTNAVFLDPVKSTNTVSVYYTPPKNHGVSIFTPVEPKVIQRANGWEIFLPRILKQPQGTIYGGLSFTKPTNSCFFGTTTIFRKALRDMAETNGSAPTLMFE